MSTGPANSWLRAQRKSDLVELADSVGFKKYVFLPVLLTLFTPDDLVATQLIYFLLHHVALLSLASLICLASFFSLPSFLLIVCTCRLS